jgi:glc operon protein GlcG
MTKGQTMKIPMLALAAALGFAGSAVAADVIPGATITSAASQKVLAAAVVEAQKTKLSMSIAIVDTGGNLIAFVRTDGAPTGGIAVAQGKARTAAAFKMPTRAIMEMVNRVGINMLTTPDMVSLGGGVPILVDNQIVGAIGASGGTGEQDMAVIAAGLALLGR